MSISFPDPHSFRGAAPPSRAGRLPGSLCSQQNPGRPTRASAAGQGSRPTKLERHGVPAGVTIPFTHNATQYRIFLLSPAHSGSERAKMLLSDRAHFDLAVKVRHGGAPLGEVYAFLSGLYFRGKLA